MRLNYYINVINCMKELIEFIKRKLGGFYEENSGLIIIIITYF